VLQLFSTKRYSKNNWNELSKIKSENYETQEWSLTEEEIKSVAGFENASVEEVELIKYTLTLLSLAIFQNELKNN
jgi:hypothetical protein